MLDMGTLLRAGKDKEAVELMETTSYIGKGERWREGVVREFEMDTYMLLYLKWITNKDQLYSTLYLLNVCGSLHGGEFGREWIHVYVWPSPFAVHLKLSQHCLLAILQYKIKKLKKTNRHLQSSRGGSAEYQPIKTQHL